MASLLRWLRKEQVPDKVGKEEGVMREIVETGEGGVGERVADNVIANNTAKQHHRLFVTKVGPQR